ERLGVAGGVPGADDDRVLAGGEPRLRATLVARRELALGGLRHRRDPALVGALVVAGGRVELEVRPRGRERAGGRADDRRRGGRGGRVHREAADLRHRHARGADGEGVVALGQVGRGERGRAGLRVAAVDRALARALTGEGERGRLVVRRARRAAGDAGPGGADG